MDSRILDVNSVYWGTTTETLMENAGGKIAQEASGYNDVAVFAGKGGNGGDGMVAARILSENGKNVTVYAIQGERSRLCRLNLERLPDQVQLYEIKDASEVGDLSVHGLIIDALIGTGISGELREPYKSIIEKINEAPVPKLSIDMPSAGKVEADMVVGLHSEKIIGSKVVDIGIPEKAQTHCGPGDLIYALPDRKRQSHKGDHGRLLVVGGSRDYVGTPTLVALSSLQVGVDLVYLAVPQYVADHMWFNPNFIVKTPESTDYVSSEDIDKLDPEDFDAVVVGNGMARNRESKKALEKIMHWKIPAVVDADGLHHLDLDWIHNETVLTPHRGEFRHLFNVSGERGLEELVEEKANETDAVILLKGDMDVISDGESTRFNETGNPYMTVGGTGDVLAGVTAGLLAQNKNPYQSACAASFLTGLAGDMAADRLAESLKATDVIEDIPDAIKRCRGYQDD